MVRGVAYRRLLDAGDPAWRPLIDLYTKVFEEGQRETERALLQNLVTPRTPRVGGHLVIVAEGDRAGCVGGVIFSYLPTINCGYVSYIFVQPALRDRGIGTGLLEALRSTLSLEASQCDRGSVRGIFAEIQRSDRTRDARRSRFRFWERARVLPLDLDWRYPPLHSGEPPVPMYLAFGPYGRRRDRWYPEDLEGVARAIFDATYGYLPSARATLTLILANLDRLPRNVPIRYTRPWRPMPARRH
jgi:GNAT superfamily N-acetyltransferase